MVIDIIFGIFVIYGFYLGYSKGIISTVFTILSYIIGLMAAFKFSPAMTNMLKSTFGNDNPLMYVAGFLLTFVLTMLLIRLFARGLEGILQTVHINVLNQAAGGVVMAGLMVLVYSVILWFGDKSRIITEASKEESITYAYLENYPDLVWKIGGKMRPVFEDFWDHSAEFMDRLQNSSPVERTESDPSFFDLDEKETAQRRQ